MGSVNRPERPAAGIAAHVCDVSYGLPALNKSDETAAPPPPYPDGRFLRRCTLALITHPNRCTLLDNFPFGSNIEGSLLGCPPRPGFTTGEISTKAAFALPPRWRRTCSSKGGVCNLGRCRPQVFRSRRKRRRRQPPHSRGCRIGPAWRAGMRSQRTLKITRTGWNRRRSILSYPGSPSAPVHVCSRRSVRSSGQQRGRIDPAGASTQRQHWRLSPYRVAGV